jgi:hypothetical protein
LDAELKLHIGRMAKISAALAFAATVGLLAPIAYAVASIRCCASAGGGAEWAGWVLIGLLVILAGTVSAAFTGTVAEFCTRVARRKQS